ncbi:MAG: hypothetical protein OEZ59_09885 [Deltaproteobacteria bacterium]|nr:hypothetical protein [Deltaproteobacteria bacterium]
MSCNRLEMLCRLLVDGIEALRTVEWKSHLEKCPICRGEKLRLERSISVFRQMETERLDSMEVQDGEPAWEAFREKLEQSSRRRMQLRIQVVSVAAVVLVAVLGSVFTMNAVTRNSPRPAKIVRVHPKLHEHLTTSLKDSLVGSREHAEAALKPAPAAHEAQKARPGSEALAKLPLADPLADPAEQRRQAVLERVMARQKVARHMASEPPAAQQFESARFNIIRPLAVSFPNSNISSTTFVSMPAISTRGAVFNSINHYPIR